MKRTKRILALVLTALLAMGAWTVFAGAQTADEQTAEFVTTVSADTVAPGETVTVTVTGTTNYYAAVVGLALYYDAALFDLVPDSLELMDVFGAGMTTKTTGTDTPGRVGAVLVVDSLPGGRAAVLENTEIFTFRLTAKAEGTCVLGMDAADQKTPENLDGENYCGAVPSPDVTGPVEEMGQTITFQNARVTVANANPELVGAESTTGYVDDANGYVYGVDIGAADVASYFAATNNGSVKVVENEQGVTNGTGAKVQLLKSNGELYKEYTLIIFGDVNGDGAVSAADYGAVKNVVLGSTLSGVYAFAADVNGDSAISAADYGAIKNCVLGSDMTVNPYA